MMKIFKWGFVGAVFAYLYLPIAILVVNSFNDSKYGYDWKGFTLKWYSQLLANDALMQAFVNSLGVACLAALGATLVGTLMALAIYRYRFPLKRTASGLLFIVMMSPDIVLAITFLIIYIALGIELGFCSLLIAHTTFCLPFVVITVSATLRGFNPNLVRASASLGGNPVYTFFRVTLPLIAPGVISGGLFAFAASFDEVVVTLFLAGPEQTTLPRQMFAGIKENISPTIAAAATVLILFSIVLLLTLEWLRGRSEKMRTAASAA